MEIYVVFYSEIHLLCAEGAYSCGTVRNGIHIHVALLSGYNGMSYNKKILCGGVSPSI